MSSSTVPVKKAAAAPAHLTRDELPAAPQLRDALPAAIEDLHASACAAGADGYTDPSTGYFVFSALSHVRRGTCCGSACRHCPFDWKKVPVAKLPKSTR